MLIRDAFRTININIYQALTDNNDLYIPFVDFAGELFDSLPKDCNGMGITSNVDDCIQQAYQYPLSKPANLDALIVNVERLAYEPEG